MKKARAWLDGHGVAYGFHDYKTAGIEKGKLKQWSDKLGWRRCSSRRHHVSQITRGRQGRPERAQGARLMLAQPSMIKRPVLDLGGKLLVGFKPEVYAREVKSKS